MGGSCTRVSRPVTRGTRRTRRRPTYNRHIALCRRHRVMSRTAKSDRWIFQRRQQPRFLTGLAQQSNGGESMIQNGLTENTYNISICRCVSSLHRTLWERACPAIERVAVVCQATPGLLTVLASSRVKLNWSTDFGHRFRFMPQP